VVGLTPIILLCSITASSLGWRWVFWVMMIFAGSCTLLCLFFLPETFSPVLLARKAKRLRKADPEKNKDLYAESERISWTPSAVLERTIFRPFKMLLVEPILLLSTIYLSVAYGVIYASAFDHLSTLGICIVGVLTFLSLSASSASCDFHPHPPHFNFEWRPRFHRPRHRRRPRNRREPLVPAYIPSSPQAVVWVSAR
jgi:MFS family permease